MTTDTLTGPSPMLDFEATPPTVEELGRAWEALRMGRIHQPPLEVQGLSPNTEAGVAATPAVDGPAVLVVGAHGWSGASMTALLLAEAAARAGRPVRLVDVADPLSSGLIGAAVTEHGHDPSGRWRCGARPVGTKTGQSNQVSLHRLDEPAGTPFAVPATAVNQDPAEAGGDVPLTVVDGGWSLRELLRLAQDPIGRAHWLAQLLSCAPVVMTARATVPAVQRAGAAAAHLRAVRTESGGPDAPLLLALVGVHRLPRLLGEVVNAALPTISVEDRVLLPGRRDLAVQGITSSDLPRQLIPAGDRLLRRTGYCADNPLPQWWQP